MSGTIDAEEVGSQAVAIRQDSGTVAPIPAPAGAAPITAAQAKVDAVAALTMSAYERAATLELTAEEAEKLQADFPDNAFQTGAAGKDNLIYVEHAHLRDRFNSVFGMGKWAIVPRSRWAEPFTTKGYPGKPPQEGSRVYVEAMLVVRGCFVGEAVGAMEYYPSNAAQNYGDAVEGAKTAAFRRCAKEFGVGLQAWKKDWCEGWWTRRRGMGRSNAPAAPQRAEAPEPAQPTPRPAQAPAGPVTAAEIPLPTASSRAKMISALKANPGEPNRDIVTEYFRKLEHPSQLMPGEQLEDLPLRFVPATSGQMRNLSAKLSEFGDGGMATAAFPPHAMDADMPEAKPKAQAPKPDPDKPALRGAIERVSVKHGPGKTGKPWTLYGICISGTWVNTFSSTIGQMAKDNEGQAVTLFYEAGEKGNNAVELVLADGTRHTAGE